MRPFNPAIDQISKGHVTEMTPGWDSAPLCRFVPWRDFVRSPDFDWRRWLCFQPALVVEPFVDGILEALDPVRGWFAAVVKRINKEPDGVCTIGAVLDGLGDAERTYDLELDALFLRPFDPKVERAGKGPVEPFIDRAAHKPIKFTAPSFAKPVQQQQRKRRPQQQQLYY